MNINTQLKMVTLSIALALTANNTFAATHALVSDNTGSKIAVGFQENADTAIFGNIDQVTPMVTDEIKAVSAIAHFFGPTPKLVLVRKYTEYGALKLAAIKAGVTTPERIAQTEVIVVPEFAAMFGIGNIDQYAIARDLVTNEERASGGLTYNDKVLTLVFNDITSRAMNKELKPVGDMPFTLV